MNPAALSLEKLRALGSAYGLADVKNTEVVCIFFLRVIVSPGCSQIRFRWTRLCIRGGDDSILPSALNLVTSQGRMKVLGCWRIFYAALL